MNDQEFWQAFDELISGKGDWMATSERKRRGSIPPIYQDDKPWPRIAKLIGESYPMKGLSLKREPVRDPASPAYARYMVESFLWAMVFWAENYDGREYQKEEIAKLEARLDKKTREHGDFVDEFVPKFLSQSIQLDRLCEHIRDLES